MRRFLMLTLAKVDRIADQFESLLKKEPDPAEAMNKVALEFERVGLLPNETDARTESPEMFVQDAIRDNQLMLDYLSLREHHLKGPDLIRSLDEMMSRMLFQPPEEQTT